MGIDAGQDYDLISTLTFAAGSGTCNIELHRGVNAAYSGTVYYRAGTSGSWTGLSVSGTSTTFPVTSTTMQLANDWNKSGDDYMTPSFANQYTNLIGISMSQKAALSGVIGDYFMYGYAFGCTSLTSLVTPDTSGITSVGDWFMRSYAEDCPSLTSLEVPDTSAVTSVGSGFMGYYADNCTSLLRLELPKVGWFESNNINWLVPAGRLTYLKGHVKNSTDLSDWRALTSSGKTLYTNYVRDTDNVILGEGDDVAASNKTNGFFAFF